jgi:hypothetical protein
LSSSSRRHELLFRHRLRELLEQLLLLLGQLFGSRHPHGHEQVAAAASADIRHAAAVGLILHEAGDRTRVEVVQTVRATFDPYVHGAEVRFTAACWMAGARAGLRPAPKR